MNRPATASQSLGGHQRKMFLAFRICARPISSKKEGHFSLAFCPPSIRAGGGANADSVLRKLFFGERISQNTRLIFFEFGCRKRRRRGLGRNPPLAPLFSFSELGTGLFVTIKLKKVLISVSIILCPKISNSYMLSIYGK